MGGGSMGGAGRRRRTYGRRPPVSLPPEQTGSGRPRLDPLPATTAWVVLLLGAALILLPCGSPAAKPHGEDVHRRDGDCMACHTRDAAELTADPSAARTALAPDLEARCNRCHGDEGPSHKTGIVPKRAEPSELPLASDGTISCATCHYMHGESNAFGDFLRLDNHRGGLCLSCHELSELQ